MDMACVREQIKTDQQDLASYRLAKNRWAWIAELLADRQLSSSAKVVATGLAQFINEKLGKAWPSHDRLAAACGLAVRTVRRAIADLVAAGYLLVSGRGGRKFENGRAVGITCEFRPMKPCLEGPPLERGNPDRKVEETRPTLADKPSMEPPKEDSLGVEEIPPLVPTNLNLFLQDGVRKNPGFTIDSPDQLMVAPFGMTMERAISIVIANQIGVHAHDGRVILASLGDEERYRIIIAAQAGRLRVGELVPIAHDYRRRKLAK